jgi:hypothetical protein
VLRAMEAELRRELAFCRDALAAREAVRDALLALWLGLHFSMLDEGVAAAVPDAEGLTATSAHREGSAEFLTPATRQEVAETLAYALRFGLDGRPRPTGHEHLAPLAAAQLAEHLMRSGFSILRRVPTGRLHGQGW